MSSSSSAGLDVVGAAAASPVVQPAQHIGNPPQRQEAFLPFADLAPNREGAIKAIICRKWDVKNPTGKYLGTEFVLSDELGNGVHYVVRSSVAHCVVPKLEVGNIYSLRRFTVAPNKDTFRLRRDDPYLIHLEGNTIIRKLDCGSDGFVQHLFDVTPIDNIVSNGSAYLIGELKITRNGSNYLDFQLMDDRNCSIKVTIWGSLAEQLLQRGDNHASIDVILLTAMNIREYRGGIQLSSTSGTLIINNLDIPEISNLRALLRNVEVPPLENFGTLLQLQVLGREQKEMDNAISTTLRCHVTIEGIHPRSTWYYNSCAERGCKKGLTPAGPQLWCETCEKICEFPLLRYRLRLVVSDETSSVVVTLFDETAAALVNTDVSVVMENYRETDEAAEYPSEILQLVGTRHLFELKSHTYYNHGLYESFTVTRVISTPQLLPETLESEGADVNSAPVVGEAEDPEIAADLGDGTVTTTTSMPLDINDASCSMPPPGKKAPKRKAESTMEM